MKRFNGFGIGFSQSSVRALALLGQSEVSVGGEPDLDRALAPLAAGEAADYRSWSVPEKTLFLLGYQYLAVATAKDLQRPDGSAYNGFLTTGITTAIDSLMISSKYAESLGPLSGAIGELTAILKDASFGVQSKALGVVKRYRLLRDRAAWDIANAGATVKFDIVGDDPANPGVIYQRTIGENRAPDLDAVFSFDTPAQMYAAGKDLERRYADLGVEFERSKLGSASLLPILGVIIAVIVGILMFFYLYWNQKGRADLHDKTVDLVMKDPKLTAQEKADLLMKLRSAESFWGEIFGAFPWTTMIIATGITIVALFVLPPILSKKVKP